MSESPQQSDVDPGPPDVVDPVVESAVKALVNGGVTLPASEATALREYLAHGHPLKADEKQRIARLLEKKDTLQEEVAEIVATIGDEDPGYLTHLICELIARRLPEDVRVDRSSGVGRVGLHAVQRWLDPQ